jgi:hypothetical protein
VRPPEPEVRLARSPGSAPGEATSSHRDDNSTRYATSAKRKVGRSIAPDQPGRDLSSHPLAGGRV